MTGVLPNVFLAANHTEQAPFSMDVAGFTFYRVSNKTADIPVFVRANIGVGGATKGPWVRLRPLGEGMLAYPTGASITQIEAYLPNNPRFISMATGAVSHAQSARLEFTTA